MGKRQFAQISVHGFQAALDIGVMQRPLWAGNAVQPVVFGSDVDACLIGMYDVRLQ